MATEVSYLPGPIICETRSSDLAYQVRALLGNETHSVTAGINHAYAVRARIPVITEPDDDFPDVDDGYNPYNHEPSDEVYDDEN